MRPENGYWEKEVGSGLWKIESGMVKFTNKITYTSQKSS